VLAADNPRPTASHAPRTCSPLSLSQLVA